MYFKKPSSLNRVSLALLGAASAAGPAAVWAADVSVVPPTGGGFVVYDASGTQERLRVQASGVVTLPGLPAAAQGNNSLCFVSQTGQLGPCGPGVGTGAQGAQGAQGPQGTAGATGSQGPQGAVGAQGPQGAQGSNGASGGSGSQGPQGLAGASGAQGPQGATGAQGLADFQILDEERRVEIILCARWSAEIDNILAVNEETTRTQCSSGGGKIIIRDSHLSRLWTT